MNEPNMSNTLTDELNNCYFCFVQAFTMTMESYSVEESIKIKEYFVKLGRSYTPYGLITASNLPTLTDEIFTVESIRDFVWRLVFNYFSILGYDPITHKSLCDTLAFALNVVDNFTKEDEILPDHSITPPVLKTKMLSENELASYLDENKWLMMLVLIILNYRRKYPDIKSIMEVLESK